MANYEESADAFRAAIDKGNLSNRSDTLIFLARALIELDDFDGARSAARQAADAGDDDDRQSANQYLTFIQSTEQRYNIIEQRKQEAIDFYEPYPSLLN